ncbi:type II secretion system protein [Mucisphaera sp.]|uniref:type II secretion system protein n=1 Tax=Mucisphaera sp. TaxID=2913024 RepID=UPI003D0A0383
MSTSQAMERKVMGFTLIELLVVISIIALLIGILLPALGAARRTARQMQSNANVRSIHQAMVTFAQGNNERYPGLDTRGRIEPADEDQWTVNDDAESGGHPGTRVIKLLQGAFFTGEIAISPADTKQVWTEALGTGTAAVDDITDANYSYAMLRLQSDDDDAEGETAAAANLPKFGRVPNEWRDTYNTEAPVISDRNTGANHYSDSDPGVSGTGGQVQSIHTTEEGDWRGSVGYNDNNVQFETNHVLRTKWSNGTTMVIEESGTQTPVDNLFSDSEVGGATGSTPTPTAAGTDVGNEGTQSAGTGPDGTSGQAAMVYDDHFTYTDHGNN